MSTIPLVALNAKAPEQPDTLQKFGQLLQLRNMQQQAQMQQQEAPYRIQALQTQAQTGQLGLEQAQQTLKDQQGISRWYGSINPNDPNAFDPIHVGRALHENGVSGAGILKVQGEMLQQRTNAANLTKTDIANQQEIAGNIYNGINGIIGITDPTQRAQALTPLIQTAQQNKIVDPQTAQQLLANPGAITDAQLQQFQHRLGISAAFLKSVSSKESADTAEKKLTASMDPNSSLYAPTKASVALGTAPGATAIKASDVNQAGAKAAAEAAAKQPYEMALARQRQALSQGDPNAAAQLLVDGDATLSELKARGATPDFIAKSLFAAKRLSSGKYNAQTADAQYSVAKSPANVAFFGSAKSLTDPGGTLDQLEAAGKEIPGGKIPVFNSIADWEKAATGSGPIAKYASIALGVADDYAKVMGGGQGSDSSRTQALNLIGAKQSPEQRSASVSGIRGAVGSQTNSRIGSNPTLRRMYGDIATAAPAAGGFTVTAPDGSTHNFANQDQADTFKKLAGIK